MATPTPRRHPRKDEQIANRYPFQLTVKSYDVMSGDADVIICENEPCAYQPTAGSNVGTYEDDPENFDQFRLKRFIEGIAPKQIAVVSMGLAGEIRFEIQDALTIGTAPDAMILVVNTKN